MTDDDATRNSSRIPESTILEATALEVLRELGSVLSTGLSEAEVRERRSRFGPNRIREEKPRWILAFLKKFWGLSAWMIELIVILSIVLHRSREVWVSSVLLVLNALI